MGHRLQLLALPALSLVLLGAGGSARAQTGAKVGLPAPAAAKAIVQNLWAQREGALFLQNAAILAPYESGSAIEQDAASIAFAACDCGGRLRPHPAKTILVAIPTTSQAQVFLAQVRTVDATAHTNPWFVVAVARDRSAHWKLAFVARGGLASDPPLAHLGDAIGHTFRVNAWALARMRHLARASLQVPTSSRAGGGATVHTSFALEPDGTFGLAFSSGRVLSCFTLHTLRTYARSGGLTQDAARTRFGAALAPGGYLSVRVDTATPQCALGKGIGSSRGTPVLAAAGAVVSVTGRR